jgi:hypothetical protein
MLATRALLLLGCGLAWVAAPAATAAQQHSYRASSGIVEATLTYQQGSGAFGGSTYTQEQLQISRLGISSYEAPIHSRFCSPECALETIAGAPLALAALEGNAEQDVIVQLNTGGAHCCTIVQIFSFDVAAKGFREIERNFGDPGATVSDLAGDGRLELESGDDRFAYEFAPYAYSPLPLQVWRPHEGRLLDVTKEFPQALATDASKQFHLFLFNRRLGLGLGCLAAWAADEELLGHGHAVSSLLARELRHHNLRSRDGIDQGGSAFLHKLERFLKQTGYTSR